MSYPADHHHYGYAQEHHGHPDLAGGQHDHDNDYEKLHHRHHDLETDIAKIRAMIHEVRAAIDDLRSVDNDQFEDIRQLRDGLAVAQAIMDHRHLADGGDGQGDEAAGDGPGYNLQPVAQLGADGRDTGATEWERVPAAGGMVVPIGAKPVHAYGTIEAIDGNRLSVGTDWGCLTLGAGSDVPIFRLGAESVMELWAWILWHMVDVAGHMRGDYSPVPNTGGVGVLSSIVSRLSDATET